MATKRATTMNALDEAIKVAGNYSLPGSINYQNHLNSQGKYTTIDLMDLAEMQGHMHGLHLFLCHLSHQIANEKTFEVVQYGETFKLTSRHI